MAGGMRSQVAQGAADGQLPAAFQCHPRPKPPAQPAQSGGGDLPPGLAQQRSSTHAHPAA
eukprot:9100115-Pyramimonas_sp.AAC.1